MATSKKFQEAFEANDYGQALKIALTEAIELKITTWVTEPGEDLSVGRSAGLDDVASKPGYRMMTRINILDGDISNEIGSQFLSSGPYADLQGFHLSQVERGRDIVKKNLEALQKLFGALTAGLQGSTQPPTAAIAPVDSGTAQLTSPEETAASPATSDFSSLSEMESSVSIDVSAEAITTVEPEPTIESSIFSEPEITFEPEAIAPELELMSTEVPPPQPEAIALESTIPIVVESEATESFLELLLKAEATATEPSTAEEIEEAENFLESLLTSEAATAGIAAADTPEEAENFLESLLKSEAVASGVELDAMPEAIESLLHSEASGADEISEEAENFLESLLKSEAATGVEAIPPETLATNAEVVNLEVTSVEVTSVEATSVEVTSVEVTSVEVTNVEASVSAVSIEAAQTPDTPESDASPLEDFNSLFEDVLPSDEAVAEVTDSIDLAIDGLPELDESNPFGSFADDVLFPTESSSRSDALSAANPPASNADQAEDVPTPKFPPPPPPRMGDA